MQELKDKELCMKCKNLEHSYTRERYPVYCCKIEENEGRYNHYGKWHKLSTILYTEAPKECPYYTEHLVWMLGDTVEENAKDYHARLRLNKGKNV